MGEMVATRAYLVAGEREPGWLSALRDTLASVGCVDSVTFMSYAVPPVLLVRCSAEPTTEQLGAMEQIVNGGEMP